jgi:hypothetical protein
VGTNRSDIEAWSMSGGGMWKAMVNDSRMGAFALAIIGKSGPRANSVAVFARSSIERTRAKGIDALTNQTGSKMNMKPRGLAARVTYNWHRLTGACEERWRRERYAPEDPGPKVRHARPKAPPRTTYMRRVYPSERFDGPYVV